MHLKKATPKEKKGYAPLTDSLHLFNAHNLKTCGRSKLVLRSWAGDCEKLLIVHFSLTLSDGAPVLFEGFLISGFGFGMHPVRINRLQMKGREAFKKSLTGVWIFKIPLDQKNVLITKCIVESAALVTNMTVGESLNVLTNYTYPSPGGTSQWSHSETFQTKGPGRQQGLWRM